MKILGLNKDSTPLKAEDKSLIDALNIVLTDDYRNYQNENSAKFVTCYANPNLENNAGGNISAESLIITLCGVIQINSGFVTFGLDINDNEYIEYYIPSNDANKTLWLTKRIKAEKGVFGFNPELAITGDFWYNWKKELIVVFTDGNRENSVGIRYININNPLNISGNENKIYETLTEWDTSKFQLATKIEYPTLKTKVVKSGSLKCGAYQIAICFKTTFDSYTNYSILTPSIIIHGDYEDDYEIGDLIDRSIEVSFNYHGNFSDCRLALFYISEEGTLTYYTDDIKLSESNTYTFSNFENLNISSQEEVLIKNVNYIKAETLCNFNNRLLIGNLASFDNNKYRDKLLNIVNNLKFSVCLPSVLDCFDEVYNYKGGEVVIGNYTIPLHETYFQTSEEYCFYAGFLNDKGDIVDIIHIPYIAANNNYDLGFIQERIEIKGTADDIPCHRFDGTNTWIGAIPIPVRYNQIVITLSSNIDIPENITSIFILYSEHNLLNSRVLSNAVIIRDIDINDFTITKFKGQYISPDTYRVYPFEYFFNKIKNINCNLRFTAPPSFMGQTVYDSSSIITSWIGEGANNLPNPTAIPIRKMNNKYFYNQHGIDVNGDCLYNNGGYSIWFQSKTTFLTYYYKGDLQINNQSLTYVLNNNSIDKNAAGESHYRLKSDLLEPYFPYRLWSFNNSDNKNIGGTIGRGVQLINKDDKLYTDLKNQKLQIASAIYPLHSSNPDYQPYILPKGDTYFGYLTMRTTMPAVKYNPAVTTTDTNDYVYQGIWTTSIESKMLINARYRKLGLNTLKFAKFEEPDFFSNSNVEVPEEYINAFLDISYKEDNLINNELGKSYNSIYNENGIETFDVLDNEDYINNFPYRIARSAIQSNEQKDIGLSNFAPNEYKDLSSNRGEIVSLKTDNKHIYAQLKDGLRVNTLKDSLSLNENSLYIGNSDIFASEFTEVFWDNDGTVACNSQFDCILSKFGYFVLNQRDKNIFAVNGTKVSNISNIFMKSYFEDFIKHIDFDKSSPYKTNGINRYLYIDNYKNLLHIVQGEMDIRIEKITKTTIIHHPAIPATGHTVPAHWEIPNSIVTVDTPLYPPDPDIGNFVLDPRDGRKYKVVSIPKRVHNLSLSGHYWIMQENFEGGTEITHNGFGYGKYYYHFQIINNRFPIGWATFQYYTPSNSYNGSPEGSSNTVQQEYINNAFAAIKLNYHLDGTPIDKDSPEGIYGMLNSTDYIDFEFTKYLYRTDASDIRDYILNNDELGWIKCVDEFGTQTNNNTNELGLNLLPTGYFTNRSGTAGIITNYVDNVDVLYNPSLGFYGLGLCQPTLYEFNVLCDGNSYRYSKGMISYENTYLSDNVHFFLKNTDEYYNTTNDYTFAMMFPNSLYGKTYGFCAVTVRYCITNQSLINRPAEEYIWVEEHWVEDTPEVPAWDEEIITVIDEVATMHKDYKNISFSMVINKWLSEHNNYPNYTLGYQNTNIFYVTNIDRNGDYKLKFANINKKEFNKYIDKDGQITPFNSKIKILCNTQSNINKRLESVVWKDRVTNIVKGKNYPLNTIDKLAVYNEIQTTGWLSVEGSEDSHELNNNWWDTDKGSMKTGTWRFNKLYSIYDEQIDRDHDYYGMFKFTDDGFTFNDFINEIAEDNTLKPAWYNTNRLYDNYAIIMLDFKNYFYEEINYRWILEEIDCVFSKNNRSN